MRRREFIAGLSAAAWPLTAFGQAIVPVVGVLHQGTPNELRRALVEEFLRGLAEAGYVVGQNVALEQRWAEDQYDRLPALAADLARRRVAVIVALGGTPAAVAAKAATQSIPVVFSIGADPLLYGLVTSYARPGENVTGFTLIAKEVMTKRMELFHRLVPAVTSIAYLFNPTNFSSETEEVQNAGPLLGLRMLMMGVARQSDIEPAFAEMAKQRAGAVIVSADALLFSNADQVVALATHHRLATCFVYREVASAGGLMSYGPSITDVYHQVGIYAGRILKGQKPADLPVQQPVKFDLMINLRTARTLGIEVPPTLLAIADQVIE
jgi:putative tryptophan/tyrosine transport system substrate-binding protein